MKFVMLKDWSELAPSDNDLFDRSAKKSMFLSRNWFEIMARYSDHDRQAMRIACVYKNSSLQACLPLVMTETGQYQSLSHRYSAYFSPLLNERAGEDVVNCLVNGLRDNGCRQISMSPIDSKDETVETLRKVMEDTGYSTHSGFRFYNWYYPVNDERYEDYLNKRTGKVRSTIKRKTAKLNKRFDVRLKLYKDSEIEKGAEDYHQVYQASWKAHEQYTSLLNDLIREYAEKGWLRLGVLYTDNQPIAAQLWFVCGKKAYIFRLAYVESFRSHSPGTVLTAFMMQQVIDEDRVCEIDFLTGNEAYKQDWMSERRERSSISFELTDAGPARKGWLARIVSRMK